MAGTVNTATIEMPSSQWEARFLAILASLEIDKPENPSFTVKEYTERDLVFRYEHTLDINKCLNVSYYDDGNDKFNSAILTIKLDEIGGVVEPVLFAIIATTLAGEPKAEAQQVVELVNAVCPQLYDVLIGDERYNGSQTGTLHGVGYAIELNDNERLVRFLTNVELTQK